MSMHIRDAVREKYADIARTAGQGSCGAPACCDPVSTDLYSKSELDSIPADAAAVSLGCGNPALLADIGVRGPVPPDVRASLDQWAGCIAGALDESEYVSKLAAAGFKDVSVEPWRVYDFDPDGRYVSAFIRARKPAPQPCCDSSCCT